MACCVPVVVTAVGGHLDTVVDHVTGALVPVRDDGKLSGVIRSLLDDPERLARYGAAGQQRVLHRYTWDLVTDGVARVYGGVTAASSLSEATR